MAPDLLAQKMSDLVAVDWLQLRNTLMACTLFATASAYIGARALPTALLDTEYSDALFRLGVSPCVPSAIPPPFARQHAQFVL